MVVVSVNNMEDVGGHIWVGILCITGGIWHIFTNHLLGHVVLLFGQVKLTLSYSLAAISLMGLQLHYILGTIIQLTQGIIWSNRSRSITISSIYILSSTNV
jgi:hypothetical protein